MDCGVDAVLITSCTSADLIASTQCGWFISTYPIDGPDLAHLPAELPAILAFARDHDCDYVLLDCDGDRSDALPVFPW